MDASIRSSLHAIRERITRAFNDCDQRDKAIAAINANLSVVRTLAGNNADVATALPAIEAAAAQAIADHETAKAAYDTAFNDILGD